MSSSLAHEHMEDRDQQPLLEGDSSYLRGIEKEKSGIQLSDILLNHDRKSTNQVQYRREGRGIPLELTGMKEVTIH